MLPRWSTETLFHFTMSWVRNSNKTSRKLSIFFADFSRQLTSSHLSGSTRRRFFPDKLNYALSPFSGTALLRAVRLFLLAGITVTTSPVSSSSSPFFASASPWRPRVHRWRSHPAGKRYSHSGTCLNSGSSPAVAKLSHRLRLPASLIGSGSANGTSRTAASSASAPERSTERVGSGASGKPPCAWSSSATMASETLGSVRPRASTRAATVRPRDAM
jgi:hypothetical protein